MKWSRCEFADLLSLVFIPFILIFGVFSVYRLAQFVGGLVWSFAKSLLGIA